MPAKKTAKSATEAENSEATDVSVESEKDTPKTLSKKKPERKKRLTKAEREAQEERERLKEKWHELFALSEGQEVRKYVMSETFEANTAIEHVSMGWGYILSSQSNRLEVLFEEGIKMLVSNYEGN